MTPCALSLSSSPPLHEALKNTYRCAGADILSSKGPSTCKTYLGRDWVPMSALIRV